MPPEQDPAACIQCFFYREHSAGYGECHRYPPVFVGNDPGNERHRWRHPIVAQHHWCGEFRQRRSADRCAEL